MEVMQEFGSVESRRAEPSPTEMRMDGGAGVGHIGPLAALQVLGQRCPHQQGGAGPAALVLELALCFPALSPLLFPPCIVPTTRPGLARGQSGVAVKPTTCFGMGITNDYQSLVQLLDPKYKRMGKWEPTALQAVGRNARRYRHDMRPAWGSVTTCALSMKCMCCTSGNCAGHS